MKFSYGEKSNKESSDFGLSSGGKKPRYDAMFPEDKSVSASTGFGPVLCGTVGQEGSQTWPLADGSVSRQDTSTVGKKALSRQASVMVSEKTLSR